APEAVVWDHRDLLALRDGPVVPYDALGVVLTDGGSRFRWRGHEVVLRVPGVHNAINAAGALEACALVGVDPAAAAGAPARLADAERVLPPRLRRGDVVLVLGAGDVDRLGRALVER